MLRMLRPDVATIFTPYSVFGFQTLGLLIAVLLIAKIVLPYLQTESRSITTFVLASFVTTILLTQIWESASKINLARETSTPSPGFNSFNRCIADARRNNDLPFVLWLKTKLPAGDSFAVQGADQIDFACLQLALRPRRVAAPSERPQWTVWIHSLPKSVRQQSTQEQGLPLRQRTVFTFSPDQGLVHQG